MPRKYLPIPSERSLKKQRFLNSVRSWSLVCLLYSAILGTVLLAGLTATAETRAEEFTVARSALMQITVAALAEEEADGPAQLGRASAEIFTQHALCLNAHVE